MTTDAQQTEPWCPYQHVSCSDGGSVHCDWPCDRWFDWHDTAIARAAVLATLDKIIAYRKAQSKVFGVQTAWEGEGAYILELSKEQERP